MANDNVTVSGSFPEREAAERVRTELMGAGFGAEQLALDSTHFGRAGVILQTVSVNAGSRRQEAEQVLRRGGASDLQVTVRMAAPEPNSDRVPEADRLEQELPAMGHAGSPEMGQPLDAPEADV